MKVFNVLIIGAGNIGALYDTPGSADILTHAHAFTTVAGFDLLGFVDSDQAKAAKAAKLWGGRTFRNIDNAFSAQKIDIVCVCVPDENHYEVLDKLAEFPFKLVFVEKPFTTKTKGTQKIIDLYKKRKISVVVNYTRRFVPEMEEYKNNIKKGLYGKYITGSGLYGKGILHNGSHMINLLDWFLGNITVVGAVDHFYDFSNDDPTVSAVLKIGKNAFFLKGTDSRLYTVFELDLFFQKKRLRLTHSGSLVEEYDVTADKKMTGNSVFTKSVSSKTSLNKALFYAATNIYDYLTKGKKLKCSPHDALKTEIVCGKIISKINE